MSAFEPIAIIGQSCVLPGALSPVSLWEAVLEGRDLLSTVPRERWRVQPELVLTDDPTRADDHTWTDRGGYVDGFDAIFDPEGFSIAPEEILSLDPLVHWVLHCAREALQDGKIEARSSGMPRTGAVFGNLSYPSASFSQLSEAVWLDRMEPGFLGGEARKWAGINRPHPLNRYMSGLPGLLLARALDLQAGAHCLDAACSSSLYAIKLACDRLQDRKADLMLAGGVNRADDLFIHIGFCALQAMSRTGQSRPFHRDADGLVPAEGASFLLLKRYEDALASGDRVLGVIRAVGLSNDGHGKGLLAPCPMGQERALRHAYSMCDLSPADISLVECHATGTQVGDLAEVQSMARVFEDSPGLPIGSLKSNLGHLITASGAAGVQKVLAAMAEGIRPPTLHIDQPLEQLAQTPLRPVAAPEPWAATGPLRAAVNNFGFGGNNAHLLLEEHRAGEPRDFIVPDGARPAPPAGKVAIVGLQVLSAGGDGVGDFAADIFRGQARISGQEPGGWCDDIELPLTGLRFPPADLDETLAQQLLLLRAAMLACQEVGTLPVGRTGAIIGMQCDAEVGRYGARLRMPQWALDWGEGLGFEVSDDWVDRARQGISGLRHAAGVVGAMPNIPANRLNAQLDLGGPSFTVSAEELSGIVALELAARALLAGELDAALVGAVDLSCEPVQRATAWATLPPQLQVPGDAAVVLVLKRHDDAVRDGDRLHAVLDLGAASEGDGQGDPQLHVSLPAEGGDFSVTELHGHSHAASGLLHLAAGALAVHHAASPAGQGEPAAPWWPGPEPRTARVSVRSFDGASRAVTLSEPAERDAPAPLLLQPAPLMTCFAGADRREVLDRLRRREPGLDGPCRLVLVSEGEDLSDLERQAATAEGLLGADEVATAPGRAALADGIYFRERPLAGELSFVFTGPAGVYPGMGRDLVLAMPELVQRLYGRCARVEQTGRWIYEPGGEAATPHDKLWGSSFMSQIHAELSRGVLGLSPAAAVGFCSGETNALFAMGAWRDMDDFFQEILQRGVFTEYISGEMRVIQQHLEDIGLPARPCPGDNWVNWRVLAPEEQLQQALTDEPLCHLTIISAPGDMVIGGDADACRRVVQRVGKSRAYPLGYDVTIHGPMMGSYARDWFDLHHRETTEVPGVRFYTSATCDSYETSGGAAAAAEALTGMATTRVDFPAVVRQAHDDGVRIFLEHGPRDGCTKWIHSALADREHLAVPLDRGGRSSLRQCVDAAAELLAAGVPVDLDALTGRLHAAATHHPRRRLGDGPTRRYPAHPETVTLPPLAAPGVTGHAPEHMAPAPPLPPPVEAPPILEQVVAHVPEQGQLYQTRAGAAHAAVGQVHKEHMELQSLVHQQFLALRERSLSFLGRHQERLHGQAAAPLAPPDAPVQREIFPGPAFDRQALLVHAAGKVSDLFGEQFKQQDQYEVQVRLPEPPLLLVDRVLGIAGEAGSMGKGTIWTETDIPADAWYLNDGYMPAGIAVESGQADLMLISWLGIDFHNQGERAYRLLGCDLSYHGSLPAAGDTLRYEIHVDGHAKVGEVRLFFFHYDCWVNGELRMKVREGQAGFFTDAELADSGGILWSAEETDPLPDRPVDPAPVECTRSAFSREQVRAFTEGDALACFGPGWEMTQAHTRTPRIQGGEMALLEEVTDFDPTGGPWGRGYLRVQNQLSDDAWYMKGHFHNDPCMPGTLMAEACMQGIAFYLSAMGVTIQRDGWRFDPVPGERYHLECRGQVIPGSEELVYEIFVEEFVAGPEPTLYADILATADGLKIFHGRRMGVRLVPDWPMTSMPTLLEGYEEPKPVAMMGDFAFDYRSLLACAWGKPSEAFGEGGELFDGTRHIARLPGPPYHFMSRVTQVDGAMGSMKTGSSIELEYDIPEDAWYFDENATAQMPYCVLLEAVLQPCGWLAVYIGCPASSAVDVHFRNLDGTGVVHRALRPGDGTLHTRTELVSISKVGDIILTSFKLQCTLSDGTPVYTLDTGFGFFPGEAFAEQVGLPVSDEQRAALAEPSDFLVDLTERPPRYCGGEPRLPGEMLLMLDRITGYWPDGGKAGLGRARGEKAVRVDEWFFKAHFFQDPVWPGSLGLEAMLQLLQFTMIHEGMAEGIPDPCFEPIALEQPFTWKYRGQVAPHRELVTIELEILERGQDERGAFAVAESSLWVDGLRIYHTANLGLRIVQGEEAVVQPGEAEALAEIPATAGPVEWGPTEEVLHPERDLWLGDHCPNWTLPTLPLMSMVDRLAAGARERWPGLKVVGVQEARVSGWLIFDHERRIRCEVADVEDSPGTLVGKLSVWRDAEREELSRFEPVAAGRVLMAPAYEPGPEPLPRLEGERFDGDPYEQGMLFHGPAFQLLRELTVGQGGSSAVLDAGGGRTGGSNAVPFGQLNQALLDAAVHGILHDELERWSDELPKKHIAYPYRLVSASFHHAPPNSGLVRLETRLIGSDGGERFPLFQLQIITGEPGAERVWADLRLVEVMIPMGPHADDRQKRIDFRDRRHVPGAGLARFEGEVTRLTDAEVKGRDWLPGSVAHAYEATGKGELLTRQVAIKDHVAQRMKVHPATVEVDRLGLSARWSAAPLSKLPVSVNRDGGEVVVADAGAASLDLERIREYGQQTAGVGPWAGQDLSLGLLSRFVDRVTVDDPAAFEPVRQRPALYLANHQVQVESMLFPMVATVLTGVHIVTIAKEEHRNAWIGPLSEFSYKHPGVEYPRVIIYFDQRDPKSMFGILEQLKWELTEAGHSVFVHVEGELGLGCRCRVRRLSTVFLDLAQELSVPIVPVRLAGGLPVAPLDAPIDFPVGYGKQAYHLGRPVLPEQLEGKPLARRRDLVLAALNGTGPDMGLEEPAPSDKAFTMAVRAWRQRLDVDEVRGVVLATVDGLQRQSEQTRALLRGLKSGKLTVADDNRGRWLARVARWLGGGMFPEVRYPDGRNVEVPDA